MNDVIESSRAGRPRDQAKDRAIVDAMLEVLVEHGFDGASFEKVAAAADVSRSTIYRRWSTKEALVIHAAQQLLRSDGTEHVPSGLTGLEAVKAMAAAVAERLRDPFKVRVIAVIIAEASSRPGLAKLLGELEHSRREPMRIAIAAASEAGEAERTRNADEAIDAILGAIYFRCLFSQHYTSRNVSDRLVECILRAS